MSEPEVEARAKEMGWAPKEEWRGKPEHWIDADTFVARGEEILPIVKENNKRLQSEVSILKNELMEAKETIKASSEAIEELKNLNSVDTRKKMEEQKTALKSQLVEAKKEGDHVKEVELQDQLDIHNAALREAQKEPPKPEPKVVPKATEDPAFVAWKQDNPWFGTEVRKSSIAVAIATEMRADPQYNNLTGKSFFDKVSEEVDRTLGGGQQRRSKVEGANGAGGSGGGREATHSFADLPQDAKDACKRTASRVVGKGRAFATESDYQKHYTQKFFEE
jgi:hypothetical protein